MVNNLHYLKITPTSNSHLSLSDSIELLGFIASLPGKPQLKLAIKGGDHGVELFMGFTDTKTLSLVKKHLSNLNPDLQLAGARESEASITSPILKYTYSFTRHYSLPLHSSTKAQNTSQSILIRQLASVGNSEKLCMEFSIQPAKPLKTNLLISRLLAGKRPYLASPNPLGKTLWLGHLAGKTSVGLLKTLVQLASAPSPNKSKYVQSSNHAKLTDPRIVNILDKLHEPLYKTKLILSVKSPKLSHARKLVEEITLNLNNFAKSSGDQLYKERAHSKVDIYSVTDLASLFSQRIEDVDSGIYKTEGFKSLPLSSNLKQSKNRNLILGVNSYQGLKQKIGLSQTDRERHLYITGATGSGKSTLLANLILQDIEKGRGVSLVDPHGDLALSVLNLMPRARLKDLIYFDPADFTHSIKINLLEVSKQRSLADQKLAKDQLTESVISLFRKVFNGEDLQSHRIEYILRNSIQTALTLNNPTIFTIFRLLNEANYRREVVSSLKDPDLMNFWQQEIGRAGDFQRVKMTAGVTSKIGRFLFSQPVKRVFDAPKSTLDFSKIIEDQKILICNFSKGKLGEDGSRLFATTVLTKLYLASLSQVYKPRTDRTSHYLYVDEFQTYAPTLLVQMLSELRKYGLSLTMAEQSPSQQDSLLTSVLLANVGNLLCFRAASPTDAKLLAYNFSDRLSYQDLNNLPVYRFYIRSVGEQLGSTSSGQTTPLRKISKDVLSEGLPLTRS